MSPAKSKPSKGKNISRSTRAGLHFPVGRIERYLKQGRYAKRVGAGAPVYLAAVMELMTAELLEMAGNHAKNQKKTRINPRHIALAIKNDEEFSYYMQHVTIASGGVLPHIETAIMSKGKKK